MEIIYNVRFVLTETEFVNWAVQISSLLLSFLIADAPSRWFFDSSRKTVKLFVETIFSFIRSSDWLERGGIDVVESEPIEFPLVLWYCSNACRSSSYRIVGSFNRLLLISGLKNLTWYLNVRDSSELTYCSTACLSSSSYLNMNNRQIRLYNTLLKIYLIFID